MRTAEIYPNNRIGTYQQSKLKLGNNFTEQNKQMSNRIKIGNMKFFRNISKYFITKFWIISSLTVTGFATSMGSGSLSGSIFTSSTFSAISSGSSPAAASWVSSPVIRLMASSAAFRRAVTCGICVTAWRLQKLKRL